MTRLWHVSDQGGITAFEPRALGDATAGGGSPRVWAIDERRLENYLLPRDCPRVCYRKGPQSLAADVERFIGAGTARSVVVIEAGWLARALDATLWLYALPSDGFVSADAEAGYFTASHVVHPSSVEVIEAPLTRLLARGSELRVVPALRPVAAAVASSSLTYSIIRLRNASAA